VSSNASGRVKIFRRALTHTPDDSPRGAVQRLCDLLTPAEELDRDNVFDIPLLADRLLAASAWLAERGDTSGLPLGYFGASTGGGPGATAEA
jgi:putative phosphoribosyl transferase